MWIQMQQRVWLSLEWPPRHICSMESGNTQSMPATPGRTLALLVIIRRYCCAQRTEFVFFQMERMEKMLQSLTVPGIKPQARKEKVNISKSENVGGTTAFSVEEATSTIVVTAVNDAPVNTVPGEQTVNKDTNLVFSSGNNNLISIRDVDADSSKVNVTLEVKYGTLTLGNMKDLDLTFFTGNGIDDTKMVFIGTISDINAALSGLTYQGALNFHGEDTLTIKTNDRGNTGPDGTKLSDTDTITINVNAVNNAPVIQSGISFTGINENNTSNEGHLVSHLLRSTDVDTGALTGIAIISTSPVNGTVNGKWQYSTDAGIWKDVGDVYNGWALLLGAEDRIRFLPDEAHGEVASI